MCAFPYAHRPMQRCSHVQTTPLRTTKKLQVVRRAVPLHEVMDATNLQIHDHATGPGGSARSSVCGLAVCVDGRYLLNCRLYSKWQSMID